MSEQPQRPPIIPNALDVMSTWMYAEPTSSGQKRPNFRVKVIGNVPRLVVKTNVPDDKNNGRIDYNMDLPTFGVIMAKIREIAQGKDGSFTSEYVDDFIAGKKLDKPVVIASVKIGRDNASGKIYIAVLGYQRPKIQFFFGPSKFHTLKQGDGSELTEAEISSAYAMGFVDMYSKVVAELLISEFNPEGKNVAKAPTGPGGYQNDNKPAGGGGGYQQPAPRAPAPKVESFDDDFML